MAFVDHLIDWWRRRRWTAPRFTSVRTYRSRADVPEHLPRRIIAVVDGKPGWVIFECPCGTAHERIELLRTPRNGLPSWRIDVTKGVATVHPSVDYVGERRCHYRIRQGRVRWA